MRTTCVAVVLLSIVSVCQPASLACEVLVQPADQQQEVHGKWYFVAVASSYCWMFTILNNLVVPSLQLDVTSTNQPQLHDTILTIKMTGYCENNTAQAFFEKDGISLADRAKISGKGIYLRSGCADCLVLKDDDSPANILLIMSRRPTITAAEMKEFEAQAECLKFYKPQILNTDHDCDFANNTMDSTQLDQEILGRFRNMFSGIFTCVTDKFLYLPRTVFGWAQDAISSIW